ncbi:histone-lysine N-methyltransferase NSD2 isoform X2 [Denticeps clupeoides]|uniref:histone-lysine N-methyltransferase NSD2 isoform X2 n=1 Tax=Denticeps clupeoides TaxID=299321 RepID=UPI0010A552AB|nr:histone-lysine N-methyltransferase NSD2 isoform X2 [Denticeps clupeoides]
MGLNGVAIFSAGRSASRSEWEISRGSGCRLLRAAPLCVYGMDSKGRSLPSMPEPRNPVTMKQPSDSLAGGGRKVRGDVSADPALLMDQAAAQLAVTAQDGVLPKMNGHSLEQLKDLTSRVLNGKLPKHCISVASEPPLKGAEPAVQHSGPSPEHKIKFPTNCVVVGSSKLTVSGRYDAACYNEEADALPERILGAIALRKRRGRPAGNRLPLKAAAAAAPLLSPGSIPAPSFDQYSRKVNVESHDPPADSPVDVLEAPASEKEKTPSAPEPEPVSGAEETGCGVSSCDAAAGSRVRFSVGDVVWTKMSRYPWWPCMVTTDPEFDVHFKQKAANSRTGPLYHVQYFSNAPERGYVFEKNMVPFQGEEQYQELGLGLKQQPSSRPDHKKVPASSVPRKLRAQWLLGISQATEAVAASLEERLAKFTFTYEEGQPRLNPGVLRSVEHQHQNQNPEQRPEPELKDDPMADEKSISDHTLRIGEGQEGHLPSMGQEPLENNRVPDDGRGLMMEHQSIHAAGPMTVPVHEQLCVDISVLPADVQDLHQFPVLEITRFSSVPHLHASTPVAHTHMGSVQSHTPDSETSISHAPSKGSTSAAKKTPGRTAGQRTKLKEVGGEAQTAPSGRRRRPLKDPPVKKRRRAAAKADENSETPAQEALSVNSSSSPSTKKQKKVMLKARRDVNLPQKRKGSITSSVEPLPKEPLSLNDTAKKVPKTKRPQEKAKTGPKGKKMRAKQDVVANEETPAETPKKRAKLDNSMKKKNRKIKLLEPSLQEKWRKKQAVGLEDRKKQNAGIDGRKRKSNPSVMKERGAGRQKTHEQEEVPGTTKRVRKRKGSMNQTDSAAPKKRRPHPSPEVEGSPCEERPESPSDSTDETQAVKRSTKKESVCPVCEAAGEDLLACEGVCCSSFHAQCLGMPYTPGEKVLCAQCSTGLHVCFACKKSEGEVRRCSVLHCGRFYHEECLKPNVLTVFENRGFRCPLHTCLSCHYNGKAKAKATKGKMIRCLRCPVAYHMGDQCVAAGSEMVTATAIICTNHFAAKKGYSHHTHVNVSWCFICSKGGRLLCCESCPAAFHPDCLNIAMPEGSWYCNDCRAGKKPRYRDIIWVKLGIYRWWPAEIRHPRNIPTNIQHLRHQIGEFPVFFFGSKDYFWTHQGRVFPYMEGDRGCKYQTTGIGKVFKKALLEAEARFKQITLEREAKEAQENNRKPPPYKYIKVNKPCGRVQIYTADIAEIPKCNCKPTDERPCSFESECLNRMLLYECHPQVCPAADRCHNQDFTKRQYPETKIIRTAGKGWGLLTLRDIKKGEFVNEYVGELIDEEECRARIKYAQENDIMHFYMLTIDKDRIIDAGPKGNYSRFMNHSCQPNCETQKWTVNGDTRVGLFAVCDIPAGTELTFNYNLDCLGNEKTVCRCGAPNCSGFLGDRPKNGQTAEPKGKSMKKKVRRRRGKNEGKKQSEDECFRCGDGGKLVLCDRKGCTKAYHLSCLDRTKRPFGRWDCPWHHCDVCGKNSDAFCHLCPNSFCKAHQEGALRPHTPSGQLCCLEHEDSELCTTQGSEQPSAPLSEQNPAEMPAKKGRRRGPKVGSKRGPKKGPSKRGPSVVGTAET